MTVPLRKGPDEYFLNSLNVGDRRSITFPFLTNKTFLRASLAKTDGLTQNLTYGSDFEVELEEGLNNVWGVFIAKKDFEDLRKLTIWREIPQNQTIPYQTRVGTQLNRDVELGLDKLTMEIQDMNYQDRALRFPPGVVVNEIPTDVKGKLLGFDGDGEPIGIDPGDLPAQEVRGIAPINVLDGTVSLAIGAGLSVVDDKLVADGGGGDGLWEVFDLDGSSVITNVQDGNEGVFLARGDLNGNEYRLIGILNNQIDIDARSGNTVGNISVRNYGSFRSILFSLKTIGPGQDYINLEILPDDIKITKQINGNYSSSSVATVNQLLKVNANSSISKTIDGEVDVKVDGTSIVKDQEGRLSSTGGGGGGDSPWEVSNGAIVQKDETNVFTAKAIGQNTTSLIKTEKEGQIVTQVHLKSQMNDGSYVADAFVTAAAANTRIDLAVYEPNEGGDLGTSLTIQKNGAFISKGDLYHDPKEIATADQLLKVNANSSIAKGSNNEISVKHDASITELSDGSLHVAQAQADMEEEDENSPAFVKNKPVIDQIVAGKGLTETNTDIYVGSHNSAQLYSRNSIASNGDILVAASGDRIRRSVDNGKTWQIVYLYDSQSS